MSDDRQARLTAALAAESEAAAADEAAREERKIEALELTQRFRKELGKPGVEFAIIEIAGDSPVVLKRGEKGSYKNFQVALGRETPLTYEDHYAFVAPSVVYPEVFVFNELVKKIPGVLVRCVNAQTAMITGKEEKNQGKY